MNEETFVDRLIQRTGPDSSIGDDCAVLEFGDKSLLATVDSLSEAIHFEGSVGHQPLMTKLVGVNVSDIAAMGGTPRWALFVEGARDEADERETRIGHLHRTLDRRNIELVGGDMGTVSGDDSDYYSLTLLGEAHPEGILRRARARPGDRIYVTGNLGAPAAVRSTSSPPWTPEERAVLYDPPNRIGDGQRLVESGCRCAIDVSDGLVKDLQRILRHSGVGAELDWNRIPVDPRAQSRTSEEFQALQWALTGGEDFELLFTLPDGTDPPESHYTMIGHITEEDGLDWLPERPEALQREPAGYDHFE
jgi:thiamine-monophosphate kinase